ncbi:DUF6774 domain-containing protein [Anaerovorax odorimutans]|uniref:DUF6774 domain-containing protein n=1 Tax=Anaerovorax odorimutans TaxID=109327 RepID=UPI00040BBE45|nr:DUF6774 domain-containing protein [Anaerovorax odorimutans]
MKNPDELSAAVSAIALMISKNIPDDDDFAIIALSITQLGDTLETMAEQRALFKNKKNNDSNSNIIDIINIKDK